MVRLHALGLVLICVLASGLGAAPADAVVVRGKGLEIRRGELDAAFSHFKAELLSTGRLLPDEQVPAVRAQLLDRLLLVHLCRAHATPGDLLRAELDSKAFIDRLRKEHGDAGFQRLIARAGYTGPDFATNKLAEAVVTAVLDREVKREVRIPTADRRRFYDENPDRWLEPPAVRIAWLPLLLVDPAKATPLSPDLVVRKRTLAAELRDRARRGEDFGALVRAHGEDPKARGEQLVTRGQLAPEIEEPAFRLEPGQVSEPIPFEGGIGILKVLARQPPRRLPFDQVDAQITELLVQREMQARIPEFVSRLRRELAVEISPDAVGD